MSDLRMASVIETLLQYGCFEKVHYQILPSLVHKTVLVMIPFARDAVEVNHDI
jgi:hypothetical protein